MLAVVLGIIGSGVLSLQVRARARTTTEQAFAERADAALSVARTEIDRSVSVLRGAAAFYGSVGPTDPAAVSQYVRRADVYGRFPTIKSLLFVHRVPDADVAAFTDAMQAASPGFRVLDFGDHEPASDRWVLTSYVPGSSDFRIPTGVDISSVPGFGPLARRVSESDLPSAGAWRRTAEIDEISRAMVNADAADVMDVEFFVNVPTEAPGAERPDSMVIAALDGFASSIASAANLQFEDLGFRLTVNVDGLGTTNADEVSRVVELEGRAGPRSTATFTSTASFDVDGMRWTFDTWRGPSDDDGNLAPLIAFVLGTLGSLLLGGVIYLRARSRERERQLRAERANHARTQEDIVQSVADAMVVTDGDGLIVVGNRAWEDVVGATTDEPVAARYLDVVAARSTAPVDDLAATLDDVITGRVDVTDVVDVPLVVDGDERWFAVRATALRDGRGGAVVVHNDITARRRQQAALADRAGRDPLTGLANRETFAVAFEAAREQGARVALLYVDLDDFKQVNDRHGHRAGDEVLVETARRLRRSARNGDVVARMGGDEFALLVHLDDERDVAAVVDRLRTLVAEPVPFDDLVLVTGASVGSTTVPAGDTTPIDQVLERADRAMYEAKRSSRAARA